MSRQITTLCIFIATAIATGSTTQGESQNTQWNQFRGPNGDGVSTAKGLPIKFSEGSPEVVWKTPLPGRAWSSPVVTGSQIWVTNAPQIQNPKGATNTEAGVETSQPLQQPIRLSAVCLDLMSGKILRDITVFEVYRPQFCHLTNSYASPTAFIEGNRVYVHYGTYGTACLDTNTGEKMWERRDINVLHWRGAGSSPVVYGDLIYLTFDGYDRQYVIALNKMTGDTVWRRDRDIDYGTNDGDAKKAYSTPKVITVANAKTNKQRDLLVSPFAMATIAYDAKTGDPVWSVRHGGMNAAARPLFGNGLVYINAGDGKDALIAVRPDGSGDVTQSHVQWRIGTMTPKRPSQLLIDDRIYFVNDSGVAVSLDAISGEVIWKGRVGGKYWSSPIYADGHIYASSQNGEIVVIKAGPKFEIVARNKMDAGFNASPAVAGDSLILRSFDHIYRVSKAKK